ncbi:MAG: hypothetical protein Q9208_000464 [Pyrenodesmia sp. 3 TL-2023]
MREWTIRIALLNDNTGEETPATIFEKVTYKLHPTFGTREIQGMSRMYGSCRDHTDADIPIVIKKPPFKIQEEGWGEFDMRITVTGIDKGGDHELLHDLNFQKDRYEADHKITFKNPKPHLLEKLRESGSVGGEENGVKSKRGDESAKKRKKSDKGVWEHPLDSK